LDSFLSWLWDWVSFSNRALSFSPTSTKLSAPIDEDDDDDDDPPETKDRLPSASRSGSSSTPPAAPSFRPRRRRLSRKPPWSNTESRRDFFCAVLRCCKGKWIVASRPRMRWRTRCSMVSSTRAVTWPKRSWCWRRTSSTLQPPPPPLLQRLQRQRGCRSSICWWRWK